MLSKFVQKRKSHFADTEPMSQMPGDETYFAPTVPAALLPLATTERRKTRSFLAGLSLAPVTVTLYEVKAEIRRNNRVCPLPTRWLEFYQLLLDNAAGGPLPPMSLTAFDWAGTPASSKLECMKQQVEWAEQHGCLNAAYAFLKDLPESDWFYAS